MATDFSYASKYNKEANFSRVKFGADAPLLETELNEMQEIQEGKLRELASTLLPDSIVTGSFSYAGGSLTFTGVVALVKGRIVNIPSATFALSDGQSVYIRVFEKEATYETSLKKNGYESGVAVTNQMLDARVGYETSRRIVIAYSFTTDMVQSGDYLKVGTITSGTFVQEAQLAPIVTNAEKDSWNSRATVSKATASSDGLMSKEDFSKLLGVEAGANKYIHPNDATTRHVTDTEKSTWNGKAGTAVATTSANGLMSSLDKTKLDGVATGANNYTHPTSGVTAGSYKIVTVNNLGHVTSGSNPTSLSGFGITDAYTKGEVDNLITGVINQIDWKESVDTYADITTTYPSPVDGWTVNVKDTDYTYRYNGSSWVVISTNAIPIATTSVNGLMSSADKTKLDGIATGANNYVHPSTHSPSIIAQDASNRFVTDAEKSTWNGKASTAVATTSANGLMSSTDKTKLDGVATGANNYTHPASHSPSIITQDANNRFVTDTEKSTWNGKASTAIATTTTDGLMSHEDKVRMNNIAVAEVAGGTGTAITLAGIELTVDNFVKTFIVSADNNGASTTINGKNLYKQGTTTAPNLKAGKIVTIWRDVDSDCFFLKASAEGNTVAEHVLAGDTFSTENDTGLVGTMVNQNGYTASQSIVYDDVSKNLYLNIPKGAYLTDGKIAGYSSVYVSEPDLTAGAVKVGTNLFGVVGTFTADADAVAGNLIAGKTAYVNGVKVTGTMINRTATGGGITSPDTMQDGAGTIFLRVPIGFYDGGINSYVKFADQDFMASNIPENLNMFGLQGTKKVVNADIGDQIPERPDATASSSGGYAYTPVYPYSCIGAANWVRSYQPNLLPQNILSGKSIFGTIGTALGVATGDASLVSGDEGIFYQGDGGGSRIYGCRKLIVSGLSFEPRMILVSSNGSAPLLQTIYYKTPSGVKVLWSNNTASGSGATRYAVPSGDANVYNGGFCIPYWATSGATWIAVP